MALQIERVLDSFFEFSLDNGSPIVDSAPTVTCFGTECHFKTKNGANLLKKQKIQVSEITIVDTFGGSGSFNYNNVSNLLLKLLELNFFQDRVSVITGVTRFDALLDAFTYFGNDGKVPVVDTTQMKLVPTVFHNISQLTQLLDVSIDELIEGKFLGVQVVDSELKITLVDGATGSSNNESKLRRVSILGEDGQTSITLDDRPSSILFYKNGGWQIEGDGWDYNYNSTTGTITLHYTAVEGDYYEAIFGGGFLKQPVEATVVNQTEYLFDGNPAFVDVFFEGHKLREDLDYTRTIFSNNNKVTLINQDFIDLIVIGSRMDIVTY